MRHASSSWVALQLGLIVPLVMASQGCGTSTSEVPEVHDSAVAQDTGIALNFPPWCSTEIAHQAAAQVAAAVTCFSGGASPGCADGSKVCAHFDISYQTNDMFLFRACDSDSQDRLVKLGDAVAAALQGLDCTLSISDPSLNKLKDTIIGCGGAYHAIVFDSNGAVADVRDDVINDDDPSRVLNCILAANGDLTFPCLANVQLCSNVLLLGN